MTIPAKNGTIERAVGVADVGAVVELGVGGGVRLHFEISSGLINVVALILIVVIGAGFDYFFDFVLIALSHNIKACAVDSVVVKVDIDIGQGGDIQAHVGVTTLSVGVNRPFVRAIGRESLHGDAFVDTLHMVVDVTGKAADDMAVAEGEVIGRAVGCRIRLMPSERLQKGEKVTHSIIKRAFVFAPTRVEVPTLLRNHPGK